MNPATTTVRCLRSAVLVLWPLGLFAAPAADTTGGRGQEVVDRLVRERPVEALPRLLQARDEAVRTGDGVALLHAQEGIARAHRTLHDTAALFGDLNALMVMRDSLEGVFRDGTFAEAEARYGVTKAGEELRLARAEAEAAALRAQRSRIAWGALGIIGVLAVVLVVLFHRQARLRRLAARALADDKERLEEENELLQQENLMARFETLKSQIDPHFLFNAMNTLYTLVETEPEQARAFIASFSALYRRVLGSRERTIVPLREEMELVRHYLYLQHMRFGTSLVVTIDAAVERRAGFIPPFTLQMLLENAIKHNAISAARPLHIEVHVEGDRLLVRNDLHPRNAGAVGTGTGLENIRRRYAMLGAPEPIFTVSDAQYTASVPILSEEP